MDELGRKPPSDCQNYYSVSQGYRKILNNYCQGGIEYQPLILTCPGKSPILRVLLTLLGRTLVWSMIIIAIFLTIRYLFGNAILKAGKNFKEIIEHSFNSSDDAKDVVLIHKRDAYNSRDQRYKRNK